MEKDSERPEDPQIILRDLPVLQQTWSIFKMQLAAI